MGVTSPRAFSLGRNLQVARGVSNDFFGAQESDARLDGREALVLGQRASNAKDRVLAPAISPAWLGGRGYNIACERPTETWGTGDAGVRNGKQAPF